MSLSDITSTSLKIRDEFFAVNNNGIDKRWELLRNFQDTYLSDYTMSAELLMNYNCVTTALLDCLKPTIFSKTSHVQVYDSIFLSGIHHESFMVLMRTLEKSCESFQQSKILDLLEKFIQGSSIDLLLLDQSVISGIGNLQFSALSSTRKDIIPFIVSLPERVANKTKGQMKEIFRPACFFDRIISSIVTTLTSVHLKMKQCENCTLEFIGKLVGRICILGHGNELAKRICFDLIRNCKIDFVWRRLLQNLIKKIPSLGLEPFVTKMLLTIPWYGLVEYIFGDEGVTNSKLCNMMTVNLILVSFSEEVLILQNVIGYFACNRSRHTVFWKIFNSAVKVWSNESAMKHQSFQHQKYLASSLIICAGWMKKIEDISEGKKCLNDVVSGTSVRVGCTLPDVRILGLVVGDLVVSALDPEAPSLVYEDITDEKLVTEMKSLIVIPSDNSEEILTSASINTLGLDALHIGTTENVNHVPVEKQCPVDRDSDDEDDLEPYAIPSVDLSVKRPFYLHDCLRGLVEDDGEWFEQCLAHVCELIEANPDTVQEVAVEMAKIMLHMDDKPAIPNYKKIREDILVSLLIKCPVLVADYLTSQFYATDYTISQRLDILEVISSASVILSRPTPFAQVAESAPSANESQPATWQRVVNERLATQTRYITKTKPRLLEEAPNKFSLVAGYFFFPLIAKYDKKNPMLKLFDNDTFVLGKLINTLRVVVQSAENTPMSLQMAKVFLQFIADVRNNKEAYVRESCIFGLFAVYTTIPGHLLLDEEMIESVLDSRSWLQSVMDNDVETDCQVRASYVLAKLFAIFKNEAKSLKVLE